MKKIILLMFVFLFCVSFVNAEMWRRTGDEFNVSAAGVTSIYGITTNGSDFWILDQSKDYVYHVNSSGHNQTGGFNVTSIDVADSGGITTNGSDFWILDMADEYVYHFNSSGDTVGDGFSVPANAGDGIDTNGSDFWVAAGLNNRIYHYNSSGDIVKSITYTGINGVKGIAIRNDEFWIVSIAPHNYVFHLNSSGGNQTDGFSIASFSTNAMGMTMNDSDMWIIDNGKDLVYHLSLVTPIVEYTKDEIETVNSNFLFSFNITNTTINSSLVYANFTYNNTLQNLTKTVSLVHVNFSGIVALPYITNTSETKGVYFNYTLNGLDWENISGYNQTIYQIYVDSCGSTTNDTTLNITFKDEIGLEKVSTDFESYFKVWKNYINLYRNYTFNDTGVDSYKICIYPNWTTYYTDALILYDSTLYSQRTYYYVNQTLTNTTTYDTLYLLSTANTTDVTLTLTDEEDNKLVGYYVDLLRFYPAENLFRTVEIGKTDEDGSVLEHVLYKTGLYKWRFRSRNTIIKETGENFISSTTLNYQLILGVPYLEDYMQLGDISSGLTWNNVTNTFTFSWSDSGTEAEYYCLKVDKISALGRTNQHDNCVTDRSGTMSYTITTFTGRFIAQSYTKQSGSPIFIYPLILLEVVSTSDYLIFGGTGLVLAGIMMMSITMAGFVMMGIAGIPLFALISLGAFSLMGMVALKITTFVTLCLLVGVMLWKIRQ